MKNQIHSIVQIPLVRNAIRRSPWRRGFLLSAFVLALAWLAVAPPARAVCQEGCDSFTDDTFLGESALNQDRGTLNTAIGYFAMFSNTIGVDNTAIGSFALNSNTTGNWNTATGEEALENNTTGGNNTADGLDALFWNITGSNNTATGASALKNNTTGSYDTATGERALYSNTTGSNNTAGGYQALYSNTTGSGNTANGDSALYSNTTGSDNTASGISALKLNTTGGGNTANGDQALLNNTTGSSNTATGLLALASNPMKNKETMFTFRVARPTDNLPEVLKFYRDGLGLEVLTTFNGEGFEGVILGFGHKSSPYHLEFTHQPGHKVGKAPTQDNLLVFYIPDKAEWKSAVERMQKHGYKPVKSYNPYWDDGGKTFEDVDGYRVVLVNYEGIIGTAAISLSEDKPKVMFAEEFTSPLSAGWSWIREDPKAWKVENGTLLLRSLPGAMYKNSNNASNALLRKASITSKVLILEVFLENQPEIRYEHAGLYWYYDDDNYVCLLKEQMGSEVWVRVVREEDAKATIVGESKYDAKGVWFRLVITEGKATGYYRQTDKADWRKMAQVDLPSKGAPKVGLNAGGGTQNAERWVRFSHFRILEQAE